MINREFALAGFDTFGAPLHSGIVAPYILHYGTEDQKKRWLPKLATGELVGAIAMTEPGTGSDLQGVRASAKKSGNGYVLNGSKTFITNGQHANLIIVVAKTDPKAGAKGTSLFAVEADDAQGFRRGRKLKKLGMKGAERDELLARISPSADYGALKDCDLVIEAVFEDRKVKSDVIAKIQAVIGDAAIFASNTSTLPITSLASEFKEPARFIGIHFFSPVDRMISGR